MADTILIVEDDFDSRELLASLVELSGHKVEVARDGLDALLVLERIRPCMILLDLMMPRMNGWELRQRMLADPGLAEIPVVVLSGVADMQSSLSELSAKAAFCKPIDLGTLLCIIQEHC